MRELSRFLRSARERLGLSAREVADRVGFHHSTITMLERGGIDQPRPDKLVALAKVYEVDAADVLTLAGYQISSGMPSLPVYLRRTSGLPEAAIDELEGHYQYLRSKYGVADRPRSGEDEDERAPSLLSG